MTSVLAKLPPTIFPPLSSHEELIAALQDCTGEPRQTVMNKLLAEHECGGVHVKREAEEFGLTPYEWSDRLIEFYRTTKSFLYESAVWNRSPLKQTIRAWIGGFLQREKRLDARILLYGDGMGFDSTYCALLGGRVTYFEPSEECAAFARKVFEQNGVTVTHIPDLKGLKDGEFDVVVCLDVLEHVPSPPEMIQSFSRWLAPGGFLITHSPYFYLEPYHPTHLASNRRYAGDDAMFKTAGLYPYDGRLFWDPIVLKKGTGPDPGRRTGQIAIGKPLLQSGRYIWPVHSQAARIMSASDSRWARELRAMGAS